MCPFSDESKLAVLYKGKYRQQIMHLIYMVLFWYPTLPGRGKAAMVLQPFSKEGQGHQGD